MRITKQAKGMCAHTRFEQWDLLEAEGKPIKAVADWAKRKPVLWQEEVAILPLKKTALQVFEDGVDIPRFWYDNTWHSSVESLFRALDVRKAHIGVFTLEE